MAKFAGYTQDEGSQKYPYTHIFAKLLFLVVYFHGTGHDAYYAGHAVDMACLSVQVCSGSVWSESIKQRIIP